MRDGQIQRNLVDSVCKIKTKVLTDDFNLPSILKLGSLLREGQITIQGCHHVITAYTLILCTRARIVKARLFFKGGIDRHTLTSRDGKLHFQPANTANTYNIQFFDHSAVVTFKGAFRKDAICHKMLFQKAIIQFKVILGPSLDAIRNFLVIVFCCFS